GETEQSSDVECCRFLKVTESFAGSPRPPCQAGRKAGADARPKKPAGWAGVEHCLRQRAARRRCRHGAGIGDNDLRGIRDGRAVWNALARRRERCRGIRRRRRRESRLWTLGGGFLAQSSARTLA